MAQQLLAGEALRGAAFACGGRNLRNTQSRAVRATPRRSGGHTCRRLRVQATLATEKVSVESAQASSESAVVGSTTGGAHSLADILAPVRTDMDVLQQNLQNVRSSGRALVPVLDLHPLTYEAVACAGGGQQESYFSCSSQADLWSGWQAYAPSNLPLGSTRHYAAGWHDRGLR